ncbi:MAG: hypothetical protein VB852_02940 [Deltaproteobacteria bacterium]
MNAIEKELAADRALLEVAASGGRAGWRTWQLDSYAVVAGRGSDIEADIDTGFCAGTGIPVVRRFSGGGTVLVGPGTLQWAIALPEGLLDGDHAITSARNLSTGIIASTLGLERDRSGDLTRRGRKVGGLAMRKIRGAVLAHGSLLVTADLERIARALRHPRREPDYRRGRSHGEFLDNLGVVDADALGDALEGWLGHLGDGQEPCAKA